jgi:hypothetical protein
VGTNLDADFIRQMPASNRSALIGRFIHLWPKAPSDGLASTTEEAKTERAERHVVSLGFGRFKVIEGIELTPDPVTQSEAYALAGKPEPQRRASK